VTLKSRGSSANPKQKGFHRIGVGAIPLRGRAVQTRIVEPVQPLRPAAKVKANRRAKGKQQRAARKRNRT
jgi:hypothetical protein